MNVNRDLIGKTITGVIATSGPAEGVRQIWMLQFSDGTHVEFVSPAARRSLQRFADRGGPVRAHPESADQLALNVA